MTAWARREVGGADHHGTVAGQGERLDDAGQRMVRFGRLDPDGDAGQRR
jgi:hypothetical protein